MAKITKKLGDKPASTSRRADVRRTLQEERKSWRTILDQPNFFIALAIAALFIASLSSIVLWAAKQPMARDGQIMFDTLAARIDFDIVDTEATRNAREAAADAAPAVYRALEGRIEAFTAPLYGLPKVVAGKATPADLPPELVTRLHLTTQNIEALQTWLDEDGEPNAQWTGMVDSYVTEYLNTHPLISADQFSHESLAPSGGDINLHLTINDQERTDAIKRADLVSIEGDKFTEAISRIVDRFPPDISACITASLTYDPNPTFRHDEAATTENQRIAHDAVQTQFVTYNKGTLIYTAGTTLSSEQLVLLKAEHQQFEQNTAPRAILLEKLGVVGLITIIISVMAGAIAMFRPSLYRKSLRLLVLAVVITAMLAFDVALTSAMPRFFLGFALATTLLLAVILVIAYGRAVAMTLAGLFALLINFALPVPVGYVALIVGAIGLNVWQLHEIRDRNRLLRSGIITGLAAAVAAAALAILYRPVDAPGFVMALLFDSAGAAASGLFVGIFMLGILSTVERIFSVTTGLTLVELRDPKQPLLRKMLERAPGTWNHSLQVANIAETAAEAIGADSLLTYVGALYHDIGKMNKPAYFVENQSDGENRHARLSPAMSLLIIVGHVKDGIEMAREFALPKVLHHFIEAHHGTTLVEYFYHVAKEKAEASDSNDEVSELEYRYPGPKPRSKEVAILMLADAVESASRAMPEKSPIRLEQLVRNIGQKRLLDGQFNHCDLTLRELHQIEDSIIKSLNAMHHARISYPSDAKHDEDANNGNGHTTSTTNPPTTSTAHPTRATAS